MDETERERRRLLPLMPGHLEEVRIEAGQTWSPEELQRDFEVLGFAAPLVVVRRRSDGVVGSLEFTHSPRVYFNWQPDQR